MRIFLYEFVTGGGWWSVDPCCPPMGSLLREGAAMVAALAEDFAMCGDVAVLRDTRCGGWACVGTARLVASADEERRRFKELVDWADATVVIAPEFDRHLEVRCRWVAELGGRLLSPDPQFVALAGDKQRTADRLSAFGVRVPHGCLISDRDGVPEAFPFPAVIKPRDGAGSIGVLQVADQSAVPRATQAGGEYRLEEYQPGLAASISVIAGPGGPLVLPASQQRLSDDGHFQYLGGQTPLSPPLCHRAERLARAVCRAFPPTIGYFGIDLVFGDRDDGSRDCVIEVNPRLTTSYLGLRQIVRGNLAEAMWRVAGGERVVLSFDWQPVQFDT